MRGKSGCTIKAEFWDIHIIILPPPCLTAGTSNICDIQPLSNSTLEIKVDLPELSFPGKIVSCLE